MDILKQLHFANQKRDALVFNHFAIWQPVDWSNAVAGEVGELCNIIKKMKRLNCDSDRNLTIEDVANEAGDIVIYLEILCQRLGINLGNAVVNKFNTTSIKYGMPEIQIYYY